MDGQNGQCGQQRSTTAIRHKAIVAHAAAGSRPVDIARQLLVSERTVRRAVAAAREELTSHFSETLTALSRRALEGGAAALAVLEAVAADPGSSLAARVAAARAQLDIALRLSEAIEVQEQIRGLEERLNMLRATSPS